MADVGGAGWDVGERPSKPMAYLEYPTYQPSLSICRRDGDELRVAVPKAQNVMDEQARIEVRNQCGWASETRDIYKPLGAPEELAPTGIEQRRRKGAEYIKPRVVLPREKSRRKSGEIEDEHDHAITLRAGVAVQGEVSQFEYQYYQFELKEPVDLHFELRTLAGDPDIFVSNEVLEPKQEERDHTWKSAATGDDEILIRTTDPKYRLGKYYIGVYSVCDSDYEIIATLQEPPTRITLPEERSQGNGYSTLAQMVSHAESRRRACYFGIEHSPRPPPRDPSKLLRSLPAHLQTAVYPPATRVQAPAAAAVAGSPPAPKGASLSKSSSARNAAAATTTATAGAAGAAGALHSSLNTTSGPMPAVTPKSRHLLPGWGKPPGRADAGGGSGGPSPPSPRRAIAELPHTAVMPASALSGAPSELPQPPVSVLTTPYLASAYFGAAMGPLRGKPSTTNLTAGIADILAETGRDPAAHAATAASPSESGRASPTHPWLPTEKGVSKQTKVEVAVARAPTDLTPKVMQVRHHAMKGDLEMQMARIARGIEAEVRARGRRCGAGRARGRGALSS